ncbi:hypothetical protein BGZ83_001442 [Gryganskiella cystojenkinii]|nr:hypothetical protein BGZ83_001442 [Gryganskiella cystojenkinii]
MSRSFSYHPSRSAGQDLTATDPLIKQTFSNVSESSDNGGGGSGGPVTKRTSLDMSSLSSGGHVTKSTSLDMSALSSVLSELGNALSSVISELGNKQTTNREQFLNKTGGIEPGVARDRLFEYVREKLQVGKNRCVLDGLWMEKLGRYLSKIESEGISEEICAPPSVVQDDGFTLLVDHDFVEMSEDGWDLLSKVYPGVQKVTRAVIDLQGKGAPFPEIARDLPQFDMYIIKDQEPVSGASSKPQKIRISHGDKVVDVTSSVQKTFMVDQSSPVRLWLFLSLSGLVMKSIAAAKGVDVSRGKFVQFKSKDAVMANIEHLEKYKYIAIEVLNDGQFPLDRAHGSKQVMTSMAAYHRYGLVSSPVPTTTLVRPPTVSPRPGFRGLYSPVTLNLGHLLASVQVLGHLQDVCRALGVESGSEGPSDGKPADQKAAEKTPEPSTGSQDESDDESYGATVSPCLSTDANIKRLLRELVAILKNMWSVPAKLGKNQRLLSDVISTKKLEMAIAVQGILPDVSVGSGHDVADTLKALIRCIDHNRPEKESLFGVKVETTTQSAEACDHRFIKVYRDDDVIDFAGPHQIFAYERPAGNNMVMFPVEHADAADSDKEYKPCGYPVMVWAMNGDDAASLSEKITRRVRQLVSGALSSTTPGDGGGTVSTADSFSIFVYTPSGTNSPTPFNQNNLRSLVNEQVKDGMRIVCIWKGSKDTKPDWQLYKTRTNDPILDGENSRTLDGGRLTLQNMIAAYLEDSVTTESGETVCCPSGCIASATEKRKILAVSRYVVLLFNRFQGSSNDSLGSKIEDYVHYDCKDFDISKFTSTAGTDDTAMDVDDDGTGGGHSDRQDIRNYNLAAVIDHQGTNLDNGHYTAKVKQEMVQKVKSKKGTVKKEEKTSAFYRYNDSDPAAGPLSAEVVSKYAQGVVYERSTENDSTLVKEDGFYEFADMEIPRTHAIKNSLSPYVKPGASHTRGLWRPKGGSYLISLLQCMANTPELKNWCLETDPRLLVGDRCKTLREFCYLVRELWHNVDRESYCDPSKFKFAVDDYDGHERIVHESWALLIKRLVQDASLIRQRARQDRVTDDNDEDIDMEVDNIANLENPFEGILKVYCRVCRAVYQHKFLLLNMPIPARVGKGSIQLEEIVRQFFASPIKSLCENCGQKTKIEQKDIRRCIMPAALAIHIDQFPPSVHRAATKVICPRSLDFSRLLGSKVASNDAYDLCALLYHSGCNPDSAKYDACVQSGGAWYWYNGQQVTPHEPFKSQNDGSDGGTSADESKLEMTQTGILIYRNRSAVAPEPKVLSLAPTSITTLDQKMKEAPKDPSVSKPSLSVAVQAQSKTISSGTSSGRLAPASARASSLTPAFASGTTRQSERKISSIFLGTEIYFTALGIDYQLVSEPERSRIP